MKGLDGKSNVGQITKQWTGLAREAATDATNFDVRFPLDLDIKVKAIVLGAVFLLVGVNFSILQCVNIKHKLTVHYTEAVAERSSFRLTLKY